jgi:hypothetical protein
MGAGDLVVRRHGVELRQDPMRAQFVHVLV